MRKDIILSGVGGQGILTIATIIGEPGMSQPDGQEEVAGGKKGACLIQPGQ